MISQGEMLEDPRTDEIGVLLKQLAEIRTWTRHKRKLKEQLLVALKRHGYQFFWARFRSYKIRRIGDSYLYKVPPKAVSDLECFRGKTVRIVRVGSSRFDVELAAKAVDLLPKSSR
jgi:hypothetical protein